MSSKNQECPVATDSELYSGYVLTDGQRIQVDFQVSVGASKAEKDSAFLDALAQHVQLDYCVLG